MCGPSRSQKAASKEKAVEHPFNYDRPATLEVRGDDSPAQYIDVYQEDGNVYVRLHDAENPYILQIAQVNGKLAIMREDYLDPDLVHVNGDGQVRFADAYGDLIDEEPKTL